MDNILSRYHLAQDCRHPVRLFNIHAFIFLTFISWPILTDTPSYNHHIFQVYKLLISITLRRTVFVVLGGSCPPPMINSLFESLRTLKCLV
jgi:hypothetical protein